MSEEIFIGFDTSNYTTSVAAVTNSGEVINIGKILPVKVGERGLRQSDALFHHTVRLPELLEDLKNNINCRFANGKIAAIGVSSVPRRAEGSYMPCFLAGVSAASTAAALMNLPLFNFSHQEGHIEAAIIGSRKTDKPFPKETNRFYAFHMSGGTCELVICERDEQGYQCDIVAETLDITVGQLIDRCGVKLGLAFPCGKALEKLALQSTKDYKINISGDGTGKINLSGFENKFDLIIKKESPIDASKFVFDVAVAAILEMLKKSGGMDSPLPVLFAGGVMSSTLIKEKISGLGDFYFTPPEFATDNATGIAALTLRRYK